MALNIRIDVRNLILGRFGRDISTVGNVLIVQDQTVLYNIGYG